MLQLAMKQAPLTHQKSLLLGQRNLPHPLNNFLHLQLPEEPTLLLVLELVERLEGQANLLFE